MSPASKRPPASTRRQQGWTDEPCTSRLPLDPGPGQDGFLFPCQKTVPTYNGHPRSHKDHWWEGKIAGRPASIAWKE